MLRTISEPYHGTGTVSIVEDARGNAEKLALYHQSDSSALSAIPEGTCIVVKEPYYKFNMSGDYMVCVDHPSDVVLLGDGSSLIPEHWRSEGKPTETTDGWREKGDRAFIEKDLRVALYSYTRALASLSTATCTSSTSSPSTPSIPQTRASLHAKRSNVNLALRRFDAARSDAIASVTGSAASDWRAYLTAARAAYGLEDYAGAEAHLLTALGGDAGSNGTTAATPGAAVLSRELERVRCRLREQETGVYDFVTLEAAVDPKNGGGSVNVDVASFTRNTVVGLSPHHGRGLFATRDIKAGEIVFVDKAACLPAEFNNDHNAAALFANLVMLCRDSPGWHARVLDLTAGDDMTRSGKEGMLVDEKDVASGLLGAGTAAEPVLDIHIIEAIRRKNCFAAPHTSLYASRPHWNYNREGLAKGLWLHAAYANHACLPNTNRAFIGDLLISRASVDIRKGEEILQIYLPPKVIYTQRKEQFDSWGFHCGCFLCSAEKASPDARHDARAALLRDLEPELTRRPPMKFQPDAVIRGIEKRAKKLEEMYEDEVYANLPRLALVWPTMWLAEAYHTRKAWRKCAAWSMRVLRNFGWLRPLITVNIGGKDVERLNVYISPWTDEEKAAAEKERLAGSDNENGASRNDDEGFGGRQRAITTFECVKALLLAEDSYRALGDEVLARQCRAAAHVGYRTLIGFDRALDDVQL